MDSFGAYARSLMLKIAEKRERLLQSVIKKKLCDSGRIMPNELLLVEESDWLGRVEYRFPVTNKPNSKE